MENKMRGKAWVFEGLLDVDWEILPFDMLRELKAKGVPFTYEVLGKYVMTMVDPEFPKKVQKGDFIVAGECMGYGHDHDEASMAIKGAGVDAVLCESSNGNFLRNCIDHGLPVIECRGINSMVKQGDSLEIDLKSGIVKNLGTGAEMQFPPIPQFLLEKIYAGGLYPYLEQQVKAGKI